jgi:hypothetical protein
MTHRSLCAAAIFVALLSASGCSYLSTDREITNRTDLARQIAEQRPLILITRDGSEYWLVGYELTDSTLWCKGYQTAPSEQEFDGQIFLDSVEYLYLKQGDFFKSVAFAALTGSVVSLAVTALQDNQIGLVTHDIIRYPVSKSCPFVYAYDGTQFTFSSETFAGSIYKGAERTVIDRLDGLKPVNGSYVLKLTNERIETDYVNELTLAVVDAPPDVQVLSSDDGVFHTLRSTVAPAVCVDQDAVSVLNAVTSADGVFWEGGNRERLSREHSGYIDRLEAKFRLRKSNGSVKLLVSGVNTELAAFAFDQLATLCGSGYAQWIYSLEHDPVQGRMMRQFLLREGLLHVSVWNGTEWQKTGAFLDSGAELVKEHVLVLPVPLQAQGLLRVRLECISDLWRIDRIALDESDDVNVQCTALVPKGLSGSAGEDALPLVAGKDDRYLTTMPGDSVVLTFEAPPPADGMKRTCFVRATGYYHHWSSFAGQANRREVEKILDIPGYGARNFLPFWFARRDKERL